MKTNTIKAATAVLISSNLFLASGAFAAPIRKQVKFNGYFKKSTKPCFIEAAGEGEVWLRSTHFNWIPAWANKDGTYTGAGRHGAVDQSDYFDTVRVHLDGKGNVTRYVYEHSLFEGEDNRVACIIDPAKTTR
jgi:hypothetical protein